MKYFPDCMMPDGAEPCKGYTQLCESHDLLVKALNAVRIRMKNRDRDESDEELYQAVCAVLERGIP